jgi:hypothetical protein
MLRPLLAISILLSALACGGGGEAVAPPKPATNQDGKQTVSMDFTYPAGSKARYLDFANRKIGGGVLGEGFVREEIAMLESNFLPWVAAVRGRKHRGTRFCPQVSLKDLDTQPVVMQVRRFLQVTGVYGGKQLGPIPNFDAANHLRLLPQPQDIYLTAMAARSFKPGSRYSQADISAMTLVAARLPAVQPRYRPASDAGVLLRGFRCGRGQGRQ